MLIGAGGLSLIVPGALFRYRDMVIYGHCHRFVRAHREAMKLPQGWAICCRYSRRVDRFGPLPGLALRDEGLAEDSVNELDGSR